jgi:16S rRNA (adenine1518-N6/adenine1519-N6)-dimethyltransferase
VNIDEEIEKYFSEESDIIVISNLPYYITTPILMKFLETSKKVKKMIFMVQYEVAKRITSKPNTKDYNALSIVIQYRASATILFNVPKNVFIPEPSVDSAVIAVEVKSDIAHLADNEEFFFGFVHNCFTQRRKTLSNNLLSTYPSLNRDKIEQLLNAEDINIQIRSEALSVDQMINLSNRLIHLL